MAKSYLELETEWGKVVKDWSSVYRWPRLSTVFYSEEIAYLILRDYDMIRLNLQGLRRSDLRQKKHKGQCKLESDNPEFREDRFVRALYNARQISFLGTVLDYQVSLRGRKSKKDEGIALLQGRRSAPHGDIDLLVLAGTELLIGEVKQHRSKESILKAVLQAYTSARLINLVKDAFAQGFDLGSAVTLVPAVVTFQSAETAQQLEQLSLWPNTNAFIEHLNSDLAVCGIEPIRFFVNYDHSDDLEDCLTANERSSTTERMIRFREGFLPRFQFVPPLCEPCS